MPTPYLGCSRRILRTVEDDPKPLTNFADNSEPWACIRWAHNSSSKQSRQAEYDRLTALPGVVRTLGAMSGFVRDSACVGVLNQNHFLNLILSVTVCFCNTRTRKITARTLP